MSHEIIDPPQTEQVSANEKRQGGLSTIEIDHPEAELNYAPELVRLCTQGTRHALLIDMAAHPEQMPSFEELNRANPDRSKSTLSEHLEKLVEHGVVDKFVVPPGQRNRKSSHHFFSISKDGIVFLGHHQLLPDIPKLQAQYDNIDKPDEIEKLEAYPRDGLVRDLDAVDPTKAKLLRMVTNEYRPLYDEVGPGERYSIIPSILFKLNSPRSIISKIGRTLRGHISEVIGSLVKLKQRDINHK